MNRRSAIHGLGALAFGAAVNSDAGPLPSVVAGVRLVDSKIAKTATELSRTTSPPYLFNHAVSTAHAPVVYSGKGACATRSQKLGT